MLRIRATDKNRVFCQHSDSKSVHYLSPSSILGLPQEGRASSDFLKGMLSASTSRSRQLFDREFPPNKVVAQKPYQKRLVFAMEASSWKQYLLDIFTLRNFEEVDEEKKCEMLPGVVIVV
ncbi:hypothetical protein TNCT_167231 [Trichonephila clavata]|uniref:Uncharacterized protein n=1 Tax=Trichonephila clavata TaxID=2740835 RepID=A0A8X6HBF5_TRICU|nr:hypothetical protein TNCT_167231 [Trichonephila clavata]